MRLYEFCPENASTFIYNIEFLEVPVDLSDTGEEEWPVARMNASTCVTISKKIDHERPHGFVVRVCTFGDDITQIQSHIRSSEVRWAGQCFDGQSCFPTLVSDVMEVKRMDLHATEVVYHDLRRMMEEVLERM